MVVRKLLLLQARRHCLIKSPIHFHSSSLLGSCKSLSSSNSSSQQYESELNPPPPESPRKPPQSVPIQPVSYPVKPKDQSSIGNDPSQIEAQRQSPPQPRFQRSREPILTSESEEARNVWTREDIRYVKNVPWITPVSYPTRVAPLPEDKISADVKAETEGTKSEDSKENPEMEEERKRIEAAERMRRRIFKVVEEEKTVVPFPTLIKAKKKEKPAILDVMEAIREVKANARRKFDETVEAHVRLGIDPKRTELAVRGNMILPHGAPKAARVAVFAESTDADEARAAGAEIVGGLELIEEIASTRKLNVDKCFATPEMARRLGKIAAFLRERGLLPHNKLGTVTSDVAGALREVKRGRIEFKMDKTSIVHVGVGKVSYSEELLRENIGAFMNALLAAKPAGLKKSSKYAGYLTTFNICSTMGPGFPVSIQSLSRAADHYKKVYLHQ